MLISLRTPFDTLQQDKPACHYATFEYRTQSIKSLIKVLKGHDALDVRPVNIYKTTTNGKYEDISNQLIRKALQYIDENFAKQINLEDVSEELKISREHLSRLIKEHTNQKFIDYLLNTRINAAKKYLSTSTLRVYEIGHLVGFTEASYFGKKFRERVGLTPKDYRNKAK